MNHFADTPSAFLARLWQASGYPALWGALFAGSFIASLFFNGTYIEYFSASLLLLCLLMLAVAWRGYWDGFQVPRSALSLFLTLFWAWLALGLLWSRVPYVSMVNFWWVGSFTLVFWLATLTPDAERCWTWASRLVLLIGLALALTGLYQLLVLNGDPRSTFLSRNSHAALLILISIPASTHFLLARPGHGRNALAAMLFVFFLGIAVTGSRGVMLSLLLAVGVVAAVAYRRIPMRRLGAWLAIILGAYLLANFLLQGWLGGRLSSVFDPSSAGHDRFLIWSRAWQMVVDNPWLGIGLGTYWLFWPPYRHPADSSAGFYVHNDYLQIWIETGLPGLVFLVAVEVAVLALFVRMLRDRAVTDAQRVELAGLFGGLLAIGFHTFFDFDLYVQPILLAIGLMLARLQLLDNTRRPVPALVVSPAQRFGRRGYRLITLLALFLPILYFTALGLSARFTVMGREHAQQGRWVEASQTLNRAWQLMPTSDLTLVTQAELLRQAIQALPADAMAQRKTLFDESLAQLADAERVNPVRPQIHYIRGMLYQQNPTLAGPRWLVLAADSYRQALRIDPRSVWTRMAYARMLLEQKRFTEARAVLEGGIDYWYFPDPNVFGYYMLTADLRRQAGDLKGAQALHKKVEQIQRGLRVRTDPFGPRRAPLPEKNTNN